MISEVYLPINDKMAKFEFSKNRNLTKSSTLEPKLDPLMKSKMLYIGYILNQLVNGYQNM
jgi:hypothetical protein